MTNDPEGRLWLERFGLVYCAFIVPSDLFATPVKALFSTDGKWQLGSVPGWPWEMKSGWFDSFFHPWWQTGVAQVRIVRDSVLAALPPERQRRKGNLLLVNEHFLDYVAELRGKWMPYDSNDPRFCIFVSRNRETISYVFQLGTFLYIASHCYCFAIDEINFLRGLSGCRPRYACIISCTDGIRRGVFCFLFRRELSHHHRILLEYFSQLLLTYCGSFERSELQRRATLLHNQLLGKQADFHALRTALATLQNKLQVLRLAEPTHANTSYKALVQNALDCQMDVLSYLDRLETAAQSFKQAEGPFVTVQTIADLLSSYCDEHDRERLTVHLKNWGANVNFELPGPLEELAEAFHQFIDGALRSSAQGQKSGVDLFVGTSPDRSELMVWVESAGMLPDYLQQAIDSVSILDRLPSLKPGGGRGILSAIGLIRNQYQGRCDLTTMATPRHPGPCAFWDIRVPIKVKDIS